MGATIPHLRSARALICSGLMSESEARAIELIEPCQIIPVVAHTAVMECAYCGVPFYPGAPCGCGACRPLHRRLTASNLPSLPRERR
jgi:hypothetical protein